jgi:hypothetical protein
MPVMTTTLREQLADVKARKDQIRQKLRSANDRERQLRDALGASPDLNSTEALAVRRAEATTGDLEVQLAIVDREERALLASAAGVDGVGMFGESFLRDPEMISRLGQMAHSKLKFGSVQLGPFADRDRVANMIGSAIRLAAGDVVVPDRVRDAPNRGVVPALRPRLRFIDLLRA